MRDDDDTEEGISWRETIHAPRPDSERADYALGFGQPALQGEAEPAPEPPAPSRRFVLWSLSIGAASFAAGAPLPGFDSAPDLHRPADSRDAPPTPWEQEILDGARRTAKGPIEDLVAAHLAFLAVIEMYGPREPELWLGTQRLVDFIELDRSRKSLELARRTLATVTTTPPPRRYRLLPMRLREFLDQHRREHRDK